MANFDNDGNGLYARLNRYSTGEINETIFNILNNNRLLHSYAVGDIIFR